MSRFVICYKSTMPPSAIEEESLISLLKAADIEIVDSFSGTLLVEGSKSKIALVIDNQKHWDFSPEVVVDLK